jgi:DNA-directed RNA polymerase subunit RPC12/RpoP
MNKILRSQMMKIRFLFLSFLVLGIAALITSGAAAQQGTGISLNLSRNFGYSSGTGKIQGQFTLKASGPANLQRVVFYIDEQQMGEATQSPFNLSFNTGSYSPAQHTLSAIGYTSDGQELRSNVITTQFVTSEQANQSTMRIVLPILVVVLGAILLSALIPVLSTRGKTQSLPPGAQRSYGMMGGTICPKCGRPFSIQFLGINLLAGKLNRCPYCGKWSIVRRRSMDDLRAGEQAELTQASNDAIPSALSEEEKLRKELENSKYQDM